MQLASRSTCVRGVWSKRPARNFLPAKVRGDWICFQLAIVASSVKTSLTATLPQAQRCSLARATTGLVCQSRPEEVWILMGQEYMIPELTTILCLGFSK